MLEISRYSSWPPCSRRASTLNRMNNSWRSPYEYRLLRCALNRITQAYLFFSWWKLHSCIAIHAQVIRGRIFYWWMQFQVLLQAIFLEVGHYMLCTELQATRGIYAAWWLSLLSKSRNNEINGECYISCRLCLPGELVENGMEKAIYDVNKGTACSRWGTPHPVAGYVGKWFCISHCQSDWLEYSLCTCKHT